MKWSTKGVAGALCSSSGLPVCTTFPLHQEPHVQPSGTDGIKHASNCLNASLGRVGCWDLELSRKLRTGQTYDMALARDTEVVWHLELTGILKPAMCAYIDITAKKARCATTTA